MMAAAACVALLTGPALAQIGSPLQVQTGTTARGSIIGAVLGGAPGSEIASEMDVLARTLTRRLADRAKVDRVGVGLVVRLDSDSYFVGGSDQLSPAGRTSLGVLSGRLMHAEGAEVLIVGHTDSRGDARANMGLSYRQAEAVEAALLAGDVPDERIRVEARGAMEPVASNEEPAGRRANRRMEIAIFASEARREAALARN